MKSISIPTAAALFAVWGATFQLPGQEFVIDQTKPYVYIKFDHLGTRAPILEGESPKGLWLRLVNNCRVPVSVLARDTGTRDPGVVINDEVVPSDIAPAPILIGPEPNSSHRDKAKPPEGYDFHVGSRTMIRPGETLLFSVPANHVRPSWFLRVTFTLEPLKSHIPQPSSQAAFTWADLPEQFRQAGFATGSGGSGAPR